MDQCWYGQFYQISIRGPDCDTAPDPVADPRENDGRLWLWWGTKENERTASSPVADPKRMNGFGPRTGSRRRWTDGFGPCDGSEENERLRIRIDGSEDLTTQKRGFWYLLHSEIGSRASSKNASTRSSPTISNIQPLSQSSRTHKTGHATNEPTITNNWNKRKSSGLFIFLKMNKHRWHHIKP